MIIGGVATEVAEASQAGQVSIQIRQDPEFVIAATKPALPATVSATAVSGSQATVSWTAPASTGGAPITGYTVTATPGGATCSTTTELSCVVTGLSSGMTYSYSVVANNAIGTSGVHSTTVTYVPPPAPPAPVNIIPDSPVSPGENISVSTGSVTTAQAESPAAEEAVDNSASAQTAPANKSAAKEAPATSKDEPASGGALMWILLAIIMLIIALGAAIIWLRRARA